MFLFSDTFPRTMGIHISHVLEIVWWILLHKKYLKVN